MRLERLVLHNFGIYAGRHEIELRPEAPAKPIVLIGALNGGGKTTILDAIQLALYGRRARCSNRGTLAYDDFLRRSTNRSASREGAAVELVFTWARGGLEREYRLYRSWSGGDTPPRERFEVYLDGVRDRVLAEHWQDHVEEILPLEISSLFFFDGEKIEALADPETAKSVIATSINALLGLGLLDRLQNDLTVLERRKRTNVVDSEEAARVKELSEELEAAERSRQQGVQHRAGVQSELDRAEREIEVSEDGLQREGGDLFERRKEIEVNRRSTQLRLDQVRNQLRELASGAMPLMQLLPQLVALKYDASREADSAAEHAVLRVLEERDAQILQLIPTESEERVRAFLEADRRRRERVAQDERVLNMPTSALGQLEHLLEHDFDRLRLEATALMDQETELEVAVDEADRQLAGVPTEEAIASAVADRERALRHRDVIAAKLEVASEEVERLTRVRDEKLSALEKASEQLALDELGATDVVRMLEHSSRVRSTVDRFRQVLLERSLGRIEAAVLGAFRELHRKKGFVHDLRINPEDFELTLYGPDLEPIPPERLSAGERQLLAVAMLWGLALVAGRDLPMVIDTPLGRLDSEHRRLLVDRYFPNAAGQVLLLSTDEEIDERLLEALAPKLSHTYTLEYDSTTHSTAVHPGYFWDIREGIHVA